MPGSLPLGLSHQSSQKGVNALLTGLKADVNLGGTADIFKLEQAAQKISEDVGLVPALQKLACVFEIALSDQKVEKIKKVFLLPGLNSS